MAVANQTTQGGARGREAMWQTVEKTLVSSELDFAVFLFFGSADKVTREKLNDL